MTELAPTDLTSEIEFIHDALLPDPKNYHTWAYLHWLYSHFSDPARGLERITAGMWESEQCWCDSLIAQDGRNNSAWGWRWFLRMARPGAVGATKPEEEIKYALDEIHRIPHNASAWNYLRGVLRSSGQARAPLLPVLEPYMAGAAIDLPPNSLEDATAWPARSSPINADTPTPVPAALEFLADALVELHNKAGAARVFAQLGGEADQMRAAYWAMRGAECA